MIETLISIAKEAGDAIMKVYAKENFHKELKEDKSPVTEADLAANTVIIERLKESFPKIPAFSEESKQVAFEERKNWKDYFLIDPLDGTKEFIKRNGEFTVNIAYVVNGSPELGVVYAPAKDILYYNTDESNSFKEWENKKEKLPFTSSPEGSFVMVASRSHMNDETKAFLKELEDQYESVELISMGSSLKLCAVAEGSADAYPRMGPTSEWDTAAAHAVVKASGGEVYQYGTSEALKYNKEDILNPYFEVVRK